MGVFCTLLCHLWTSPRTTQLHIISTSLCYQSCASHQSASSFLPNRYRLNSYRASFLRLQILYPLRSDLPGTLHSVDTFCCPFHSSVSRERYPEPIMSLPEGVQVALAIVGSFLGVAVFWVLLGLVVHAIYCSIAGRPSIFSRKHRFNPVRWFNRQPIRIAAGDVENALGKAPKHFSHRPLY